MIQEFKNLSESEIQALYKAPVLVSLLIAGADNHIDKNEINRSIHMIRDKAQNERNHVMDLYKTVSDNFEAKLDQAIDNYPDTAEERNPVITKELEEINAILSKINKAFSIVYYQTIRDLAMAVAKSSGGFMGINAVGKEEATVVELPMIKNPAVMFGD